MKVINFISGPGAGKSVLAAQTFAQLKIDGWNVEYVPEYAKWQVWTGECEILNNQYHLGLMQFKMINALKDSVDVVVTDGSLVHGLAYNILNKHNTSDVHKTKEAILSWLEKHENLFFFIERSDIPYQEDGRLESFSEARDIDSMLKILMNQAGLPYKRVYIQDGFDVMYPQIKQALEN
jgi:hypothetical protein